MSRPLSPNSCVWCNSPTLPSSICLRRVVNMLSVMTRATLLTRVISLSVIATLSFAVLQPAWAEEEEEGGPAFNDPTIVTDDSTSVPEGVKDLGKKEKKPITDPVYEKWWFWATAVLVAGAVVTAAVIPFEKKAPGCSAGSRPLGCIGDGR
jgi:hypothetical protein